MLNPRLVCPFLVSASVWFACGGGGGKSSVPPSTASSADFCHALVDTVTALQTGCFGGGEPFWRNLYSSILDCDRLASDIAKGLVVYNKANGAACLAQVGALSCDSLIESDAVACADALVGQVPSGGACVANTLSFPTCAPGLECSYVSNSCTGVCKPTAKVGSSCAYSSTTGWVDCGNGASCQANTDLCAADAGEGQACLGPTAGDCRDSLRCEGGTSTTAGVCRKRKTSGSCTSVTDCASSYLCAGEEGAKTCRKAKLPGDSCTPGLGECFAFFASCGSDGKCTDVPVQEGAPCGTQNHEYIRCATGLYCAYDSSTTGVCRKEIAVGASCTSSSECAGPGAYCDSTTKLCVACN